MKITIKNHLSVINNLTFFNLEAYILIFYWCWGHGEVACYIVIIIINYFSGFNHRGYKYGGDGTSFLSTQGLFIS